VNSQTEAADAPETQAEPEPEFMTVDEMVAHYRIAKKRWLTDRLRPSHPDYVRHHRFYEPVFSRADRELFEATHLRAPGEQEAPARADGPEFDLLLAAKGRRILGRAS
jgi:hypothetical protein